MLDYRQAVTTFSLVHDDPPRKRSRRKKNCVQQSGSEGDNLTFETWDIGMVVVE